MVPMACLVPMACVERWFRCQQATSFSSSLCLHRRGNTGKYDPRFNVGASTRAFSPTFNNHCDIFLNVYDIPTLNIAEKE